MIASFADELVKLGAAGPLHVGGVHMGVRAPSNSLGVLVRRALAKRANDLAAMHDEVAPPAIEVNPRDASTRLPNSHTASTIIPGTLGRVEQSKYPIDHERFNRAWSQPLR